MVDVIDCERKSAVLRHPTLPCLSRYHTINLASGCPYACRYCYAQSFRSHPGTGKVMFYTNTFELLQRELPRKRRRPELVYLSTACEPFIPHPRVLDTLYGVVRLLLENGVFILISTKSEIPPRFLQLFTQHPGMVHVHVGLTTADDRVRQLLEPNAAGVEARLRTLRSLVDRGITAEVRIDPLTPELTDTEESLTSLCRGAAATGVRNAVASYLFLRRHAFSRLRVSFGDWSFSDMAGRIYTHTIGEYCGGGPVRIPAPDYRRERYALLRRIAETQEMKLVLCGCKNPDLTDECCHPQTKAERGESIQARLF